MENTGPQDDPDPEQQLEEMRTVTESLFDTFVKYLEPEAIFDSCPQIDDERKKFLTDQSSREMTVQNLLGWVSDDESAVIHFTDTLRTLNQRGGEVPEHPAVSGTDDNKLQMSPYMEHIVQTIDGSLTKKLSQDDVLYILDSMLQEKLITNAVHKKAKALQSPHERCLELFRSMRRGKPDWPFVFFAAIKKRRPELIQLPSNEAVGLNKTTSLALPGASGGHSRQKHCAENDQSALSETALNYGMEDSTSSSTFSSMQDFEDRQKTSLPMFHLTEEDKESLAWQLMIESGTVDKNRITTDPVEQVKRSTIWKNTCFSDEEDLPDEDNDEADHSEETPSLPLREYQKELSENALKGRNTIICAPTGSGKTRVAIHIIINHLQRQKDNVKVAFLARTVPLVMQQCKSLKKYLPKKYEVTHLTGDSEDSMHLHMLLKDNDVIVMTPRILENHLKRKCLPHLGVFSMLVFDECHHTRKGEPYNTLMYSYLKTKNNDKDVQLPQIVGLTASIGVEKAVQDQEAIKCILQVCGNLDAESISTVEKHEQELREKVPVPEERMFKLRERENDEDVNKIIRIMIKLEEFAHNHAREVKNEELNAFLKKIPSDKKSQQYGQWAVKIKNVAKALPRQEHRETNNSVRSLIIIADYLAAYNVALELYDLVLMKDVMAYLERSFVKFSDNKKRTVGEDTYYEYFEELQRVVKGRLEAENPNLIILKEKLLEFLVEKGEKSCGIIFVRTRALTDALTSWLNRCGDDRLKELKATVFTGTAATVEQGGMTTAEQDEIISRFKSGEVRLLVATSVGEEGLDIPECNLVIKYNHVGNEVTTVQTRGRSRKEGGMSVLLAMDKILRKERINQEKAKMMTRAIKEIRQMSRSKIRKMNLEHQSQIMKDEEILEIVRMQEENRLLKKPFKMVCHLCRKVVIDSKDIKTIFKTHRVVVNRDFLKQTKTIPFKDALYLEEIRMIGSVRCMGEPEEGKHCYNKLGSMLIYSKVPFVVLGIKNFGFDTNGPLGMNTPTGPVEKGLEFYNQWKKVPYVIDEIAPQDFDRYLPQKEEPAQEDDDDEDDSDTESDENGADGGDGGDDDNKGNKPLPGKESSLEQRQIDSSSDDDTLQAESNIQDSITALKKAVSVQEVHDEAKGRGKGLARMEKSQRAPDSGVYSDPAIDSESSAGSIHSTQPKGVEYVMLPVERGQDVNLESLSSYKSGDTHHDTPVVSDSEVIRSSNRIRDKIFEMKASEILDTAPTLSSKISEVEYTEVESVTKEVAYSMESSMTESSAVQSRVHSVYQESHHKGARPLEIRQEDANSVNRSSIKEAAERNKTDAGPEGSSMQGPNEENNQTPPHNLDKAEDDTSPKEVADETTPKEVLAQINHNDGQARPEGDALGNSESPSLSSRPSGLDLL